MEKTGEKTSLHGEYQRKQLVWHHKWRKLPKNN